MMKTKCKHCDRMFKKTSRYSKTCKKCLDMVKTIQFKRGCQPKTRHYISVNNSKGRFVGFISARTRNDLLMIKLPRGYKMFGKPF